MGVRPNPPRGVDLCPVRRTRACSRPACQRSAVATLTYVQADSTAVLGPLVAEADPHSYDLCADHTESLTVPRGWQVVRLFAQTPKEIIDYEDREGLSRSLQRSIRERRARRDERQREVDAAAIAHSAPAHDAPARPHLRVLPPLEEN